MNIKNKKLFGIGICFLIVVSFFCGVLVKSYAFDSNNYLNQNSLVSSSELQKAAEFILEIGNTLRENSNITLEELKMKLALEIYELANNDFDSPAVDALASKTLTLINDSASINELINSVQSFFTDSTLNLSNVLNDLILNYSERVQINAKTAGLDAGSKYNVKLNGYIYYADGNSTKWAVLVHPFMLNGKLMANTLAKTYLDKGYNVLAPDLRGFGKSKGSVAMGYLESLDIWDWLTYINDQNGEYIGNRKATDVIIHGISLGGATTLQTWTQVNFGRDLKTKNVIGIVDDCGYDSMTGIMRGMLTTGAGMELLSSITKLVDKDDLYDLVGEDNIVDFLQNVIDVGISDEGWEIKQNAFAEGRQMSKVPLYLIHGTADTMVPYTISTSVVYPKAYNAGLLYKFWQVQNQQHAFVIIGMEQTKYASNVRDFIDYCENNKGTFDNVIIPGENPEDENANSMNANEFNEKTEKEEQSIISKIGTFFTNIFKSIADFFKGLFK